MEAECGDQAIPKRGRLGPGGCPKCGGYVGVDEYQDTCCYNCGWVQPPAVILTFAKHRDVNKEERGPRAA